MTPKAAAARYARALFDVAVKEHGDLQEIEQQLADFVALFEQHPSLEKVMLNPAGIPPTPHMIVKTVLVPPDRGLARIGTNTFPFIPAWKVQW